MLFNNITLLEKRGQSKFAQWLSQGKGDGKGLSQVLKMWLHLGHIRMVKPAVTGIWLDAKECMRRGRFGEVRGSDIFTF